MHKKSTLLIFTLLFIYQISQAQSRRQQQKTIVDCQLTYHDPDVFEGNVFRFSLFYVLKGGQTYRVGERGAKLHVRDFNIEVLSTGRLTRQRRKFAEVEVGVNPQEKIHIRISSKKYPEFQKDFHLPVHYFEHFQLEYNEKKARPGRVVPISATGTLEDGRIIRLGTDIKALSMRDFQIHSARSGYVSDRSAKTANIYIPYDAYKDPYTELSFKLDDRFEQRLTIPVNFNVKYYMNFDGQDGLDGDDFCPTTARNGCDGRDYYYKDGSGEDGGHGYHGMDGMPGQNGFNGSNLQLTTSTYYLERDQKNLVKVRIYDPNSGSVFTRVYDPEGGALHLSAQGGDGGHGGDAQDGGHGGDGGRGTKAPSNSNKEEDKENDDDEPVVTDAYGGHGGNGGNGGFGGMGGRGGDGGYITIYVDQDAESYLHTIHLDTQSGLGGRGGDGGCGGRSGNGGRGGRENGKNGRKGCSGLAGPTGPMGNDGSYHIIYNVP